MGGTFTGGLKRRSFPPGEAYNEGACLYLKSDGKLYKAVGTTQASKPGIFISREAATAADVTAGKPLDCEIMAPTTLMRASGACTIGQWATCDAEGEVSNSAVDEGWTPGIFLETGVDNQLVEVAILPMQITDISDTVAD